MCSFTQGVAWSSMLLSGRSDIAESVMTRLKVHKQAARFICPSAAPQSLQATQQQKSHAACKLVRHLNHCCCTFTQMKQREEYNGNALECCACGSSPLQTWLDSISRTPPLLHISQWCARPHNGVHTQVIKAQAIEPYDEETGAGQLRLVSKNGNMLVVCACSKHLPLQYVNVHLHDNTVWFLLTLSWPQEQQPSVPGRLVTGHVLVQYLWCTDLNCLSMHGRQSQVPFPGLSQADEVLDLLCIVTPDMMQITFDGLSRRASQGGGIVWDLRKRRVT